MCCCCCCCCVVVLLLFCCCCCSVVVLLCCCSVVLLLLLLLLLCLVVVVGLDSAGPPSSGPPSADRPKFRSFSSLSHHREPSDVHVWALRLWCETILQTCTFEGNSTRRHPERQRERNGDGKGKKKREILPSHPSTPHPSGPDFFWVWATLRGPHPSEPPED